MLTRLEDKSAWLHTCRWGKTIYLEVEDTTSGAPCLNNPRNYMVIRLKMELKELKFISAMDVSAIATITEQMFPFCFASIAERFIRVLKMYNRGRNAIKKATGFHKHNKVLQEPHTP